MAIAELMHGSLQAMIKKLAVFSVMLMASVGAVKAEATVEVPTCRAALGDIWGDGKQELETNTFDGSKIKSPNALANITGVQKDRLKLIKGGDFSGWDLRGLHLSSVCFDGSTLAGANLAGVEADGTGFIGTDLTGANLKGSGMSGVLFRNANLTNARAQGANLSGGHFDGGWFDGAVAGWNLDGANLTGFTFECGITVPDGCPVYQGGDPTSAKGANFSGANLHSFGLYNVVLDGARLDETIVGPEQLPHLAKADFKGDIILRGGDAEVRISRREARKLLAQNAREQVRQQSPSFDCTKATSEVEKEICGEYGAEFRQLDREISALYFAAKVRNSDVLKDQWRWIQQRDRCSEAEHSRDCIVASYSSRKGELLGLIGETDWLEKGEEALFVDEMLPVPNAVKETELYKRIIPVLVGASRTEIVVMRGDTGAYSIWGSAVGANAHLCSVSAIYSYFDPDSGWYSPVVERPAVPIFRVLDDRLEIFENGRPDYRKDQRVSDFMSCGMRASFGETIRIAADKETIARIRKSLATSM